MSYLTPLLESAKEDIIKIFKWISLWRMKVSIEKTEVCIFSKDKELLANPQLDIKINVGGGGTLTIQHLGYNKEFIDLRKIICMRKFES